MAVQQEESQTTEATWGIKLTGDYKMYFKELIKANSFELTFN